MSQKHFFCVRVCANELLWRWNFMKRIRIEEFRWNFTFRRPDDARYVSFNLSFHWTEFIEKLMEKVVWLLMADLTSTHIVP